MRLVSLAWDDTDRLACANDCDGADRILRRKTAGYGAGA